MPLDTKYMRKFTVLSCLLFIAFSAFSQGLKVHELNIEYRKNPLGVESYSPALSWEISAGERAIKQEAYRVLVADNINSLNRNVGNIWDSQKVNSSASIQVKYAGKNLSAAKKYFWKVMVWDNKTHVSSWSNVAYFRMGLTAKSDWKGAQWISNERMPDSLVDNLVADSKKDKINTHNNLPLIRKSFSVNKPVQSATAFIAGLGHFELSVNGRKAGDHFLDAGWTKYDKEAQYVSLDITQHLKQGANALGVMLGNGFYYVPQMKGRYRKLKAAFGYPKLIARIFIEYKDGTSEDFVTNTSWKTEQSPIVFSSIYGGEDYNANLEKTGWDNVGYNDKSWKSAIVVDGVPSLIAQNQEPLKVFDRFAPKSTNLHPSGVWIYDLGQNASGIIELKVKGKKGDTVRIAPAELLKEDGSLNQKVTGSPYYFTYILKGAGVETWRPRFSYTGFRYLEVKGGSPEGKETGTNAATIISLDGLHVRNAAPIVGSFTSSSELFNKTNTLIDWSIKSNIASVFTDCPHREKLGWLEQVHLMGSSVKYQYDIATLLRKTVQDMISSQLPDGLIPEIAPEYAKFTWGGDMFRDSPEWGSSMILAPWYLYKWYGDKDILIKSYPAMKKYMAYLEQKGKASNYILKQGLGDWYDLGPKAPGVSQLTPMGVTGTAIFYHDLRIMDSIAQMLNKPEDAHSFGSLATSVKTSFNATFFNNETKQYATGSQTANAMAIYMELVEPENKNAVLANLIKDIRDKGNALTAGDIGFRYLLRVLENEGRSDVIFDMNSRSDVPGYGYQLAKGATALTESWAALPTSSNNHFMLGHIMEWFYSGLAGLRSAPGALAFNEIEINPQPVGDITSAQASYRSLYGNIISSWKKEASAFLLKVEVPANTSATIYLPAKENATIKEGNINLKDKKEIQLLGYKNGRAMIKVGSGSYQFVSQ